MIDHNNNDDDDDNNNMLPVFDNLRYLHNKRAFTVRV